MTVGTSARSPLAVVASGLTKRFTGVTALDDVSMTFEPGRVTAVVGENGAGKSTLMTILAGLQRPDAGIVEIGGSVVRQFTPHHLLTEHGVALVPQEIALCRDRSVAENILLGREPLVALSRRQMNQEASALLAEINTPIDPRRRAGSLSVAEQQVLLIVRALARDCRVLILDEPTASLTHEEVSRLLDLIERMRGNGTTVIYVSHRLPEVFEIADHTHVLRDGHHVGSYVRGEIDPHGLVRAMVGRQLAERMDDHGRETGKPVLVTRKLSGTGFTSVDLEVRSGEIVGVAGLPGSGRGELVGALFGATRSSGEIDLDGAPVRLRSPRDAIRNGIGYVPAERRSQGVFPDMSVASNIAVLEIDGASRFGFVRRSRTKRIASERIRQFDIRGGADGRITQLSGGNQQKVILSRWIARRPRLLLLDEPTRGVDVGAKAEIHDALALAAAEGTGVVISSADLPELLRTCDRIVVMAEGRVAGTLAAGDATEEGLMALATGVHDHPGTSTTSREGPSAQ
jgi:ABC-type sugar transport system ATPase subunit